MRLKEVLSDTDSLDEYDVIYAKRPWSLNAEAYVVRYQEGQTVIRFFEDAPSFEYFLEAPLVKDIRQQVEDAGRSSDEVLDVLLYYAENDAFP